MAIYERGETYAHWSTIRDTSDTKVDPSSVKITIKDPCGYTLINEQNMTNDSTGVYYYNYNLSSSATYGKYEVTVKSTSGSSQYGKKISYFYIMPEKFESDVRAITGMGEKKDISDDDLSTICWKSYIEALHDVYQHHYEDVPLNDPDTGNGVNGSNTAFQTPHYPLADINGDGEVTGNASCATDVDVWYIDSDGHYHKGLVTVSEYRNGEITVTDSGGNALTSDTEGVYLDYWSSHRNFDYDIFYDAVSNLAAHYIVELRLNEADRVTLADLQSNTPVIVKNERRFYNAYRRKIKKVTRPRIGGTR